MTEERFRALVRGLGLTAGTPVVLHLDDRRVDRPAFVVEVAADFSWFNADVMSAYLADGTEYKRRRIRPEDLYDLRVESTSS